MVNPDRALIAHLMRRAGFGVTGEELETLSLRPYEDIVEDLLHPERFKPVDEAVLSRYYGTLWEDPISAAAVWLYRMANTRRPLEEKTALFWHHVFATGNLKCEHPVSMINQIEMFRRFGLSDMRTLLVELSKDPAMIYWLDNNENHKGEPNENYGRELLELFSMGVGNYTETDIKMAARAFTGWTFTQPVPLYPHGRYPSEFAYREEDHDDSVKVFLGETGRLNGEDIVDIIVRQPAAARFISRHMYNFFVADEPQVPAWDATPPQDPAAVDALIQAYRDSNGNIRAVLRVLFNSDFFKEARYRRVKCPAELVAGLVKLTGIYRFPDLGIARLANATTVMGQTLMNPPTGGMAHRPRVDRRRHPHGACQFLRRTDRRRVKARNRLPHRQGLLRKETVARRRPRPLLGGTRARRAERPDQDGPDQACGGGRRNHLRHRSRPRGRICQGGQDPPAHRSHEGIPVRLDFRIP